MAIYRFKVYFEDDEEVIRVIEIKSNQTLEDLHFAILASVGFDSIHNALFFLSNDYWKRLDAFVMLPEGKWENSPVFSNTKLSKIIYDPHQKLLYVYDLNEEWTFHIEMIGISMNEDATKTYPLCIKSESKAPKQYKAQRKVGADLEDDEFDYLTKNLLGGEIAAEMLGEHLDEGEADDLNEDEDSVEASENDEEADDSFFGEEDAYDED